MKIPAILQPEDLVDPDVDELSVMTYISYFRDYVSLSLNINLHQTYFRLGTRQA